MFLSAGCNLQAADEAPAASPEGRASAVETGDRKTAPQKNPAEKSPEGGGALAEAEEKFYFFCEWRGVPSAVPSQKREEGRPSNRSFDRVFSYKKSSDGFRASFIEGSDKPVKEKRGFLHQKFPAGPKGSYEKPRKVQDIYRFHRETQVLTRSVLSYLSPEDYEKRLKEEQTNPYIIPCSRQIETALDFLWKDEEAPLNYDSKICGFDKSEWRCRETPRLKYLWFWMSLEVLRALSV